MTATLAAITRYPVKAIGREALSRVVLTPGEVLPWDRAFAVAHEAAKFEGRSPGWVKKMNFLRGVSGPHLMAVTVIFDEAARSLTFRHPAQGSFTLHLDTPEEEAAFLVWLAPLWPEDSPAPTALVHTEGVPLTDVPDRWVSINSLSSLRDLGAFIGDPGFSPDRFRGNLWIDGAVPWVEFDWIGREIAIGDARLKIEVRITRCKATHANPETGQRDADTLGALERGWGHTDFGVYASVVSGGEIALGAPITLT